MEAQGAQLWRTLLACAAAGADLWTRFLPGLPGSCPLQPHSPCRPLLLRRGPGTGRPALFPGWPGLGCPSLSGAQPLAWTCVKPLLRLLSQPSLRRRSTPVVRRRPSEETLRGTETALSLPLLCCTSTSGLLRTQSAPEPRRDPAGTPQGSPAHRAGSARMLRAH